MSVIDSEFFFVTCQNRSNSQCKEEIARLFPEAQLSFSRPGFITFKKKQRCATHPNEKTIFVRTSGLGLGGKKSSDGNELIKFVCEQARDLPLQHLHVFQRDATIPGRNDFEPGITELARDVGNRILKEIQSAQDPTQQTSAKIRLNQVAKPGENVLDVILVDPDYWWVGVHQPANIPGRWPGGIPMIPPKEMVSRAYLKTSEAITWSQMPVKKDDICVEIGAAPGGSCQRLLELGCKVIAIDPAEMDEDVLANPNLTHIQKRGRDVKRSALKGAKWLFCDANVGPDVILSTVQEILEDGVAFRGIVMTMKISDVEWFQQIERYRKRFADWGFGYVKARQMAFNRQEICIVALRNKGMIRFG